MPTDPITPSQLACLKHLAKTGRCLVKVVGGRWTTDDCPEKSRSHPSWYTLMLTVRSMIRRGWLQKVDETVVEEWRADWQLSDAGRAALEKFGGS